MHSLPLTPGESVPQPAPNSQSPPPFRQGSGVAGAGPGDIRGRGREIRGEIRQHLAAHMRGGPSWETQPLDPSNEGHERDTSAVAKGGKSLPLPVSFPLLISLAFAPRPHLSFSLPPLALLLGYLWFSSRLSKEVFQECMRG